MKMKKILLITLVTAFFSGCSPLPVTEPEATATPSQRPAPASSAPTQRTERDYTALDGTGSGWGFVRKKGSPPELPSSQVNLLESYNGRYLGDTTDRSLYLTFDEGYENGYTAVILDILQETETPAAFFVTGPYLEGQGELIERMHNEGHIVGNHTVHHLNLPQQPVDTVKREITELNERCEELYGFTPEYMRPPEGEFSEKTLAVADDLGMRTIMWSFAYKDWDVNTQKGADYAYASVMPYLHDGAIILLHAVSSDNTGALKRIITDARAQGYEFKSLDEL